MSEFANNSSGENFLQIQSKEPKHKGRNQGGLEAPKTGVSYMRYMHRPREKTTVGFERANWDKALKEREQQSNRWFQGKQVKYSVDVQYFRMYGVGIYLFFSFLKKVSILFLVMSFCELVPMLYNYFTGVALENSENSFPNIITKMTVGNQAKTNDQNLSLQHKLLNVVPDIVCTLMMFIFYFYWEHTSKREANKIREEVKLASDATIEVKGVSSKIDEDIIYQFFSDYGLVQEVAPVRNYSGMISLSKEIYELSLEIKEINLKSSEKSKEKDEKAIEEREQKIQDLAFQLNKIQKRKQNKIIKYYITFEKQKQRDEVVEKYEKEEKCCSCCRKGPDESLLIEGQFPCVRRCLTEPGGIIWENMHITWRSRWLRFLCQGLFLLISVALAFLFISFLNIVNPQLETENIDTTDYSYAQIQSQTDSSVIQSWCLDQSDPSDSIFNFCMDYYLTYYGTIMSNIGISLGILLVKLIMKQIVIFIGKFQRYKDHTELSTNIMTNLMITYICTTVLITFLLQASILGISFKTGISPFITNNQLIDNLNNLTEYEDFTTDWYVDIGYQIWLNWLILAFVPHIIMPLVHFLLEKIRSCLARKQVLYQNMMWYLQGEEFQIEDHYANVMMIIFVGFSFSGGIPSMIFLSFLGLISRYMYFKYIFIRYSRIPKVYNEAMNQRMLSIFPATLAFHLLFSLWMFGVQNIFAISDNPFGDLFVDSDVEIVQVMVMFVEKIQATWYFAFFIIIIIAILILKKIIVDFFVEKVCGIDPSKPYEDDSDGVKEMKDGSQSSSGLLISQRCLTKSYKIENNPDYLEILAIMKPQEIESVIRQTCGINFMMKQY